MRRSARYEPRQVKRAVATPHHHHTATTPHTLPFPAPEAAATARRAGLRRREAARGGRPPRL